MLSKLTSIGKFSEIFPVSCSNTSCGAHHNLVDFTDIVLLWGFICLSNKKDSYLGFTCPNCLQTSVKKYPISAPTAFIKFIEENGIDSKKRYRGVRPNLRNFVPFSIKEVEDRLGDKFGPLENLHRNGEIYTLPHVVNPIVDYSLTNAYHNYSDIGETSISKFAEIENEFKVKIFPRVVGFSSVYKKSETFLLDNQKAISTVKNLIETQYGERRSIEQDPEYYKDAYSDEIGDDLTMEEYQTIFASKSYINSNHSKASNDIISNYRGIRSRLDFELVYRDEFVNKLARSLFLEEMVEDPAKVKLAPEKTETTKEPYEEILERLSSLEKRFSELEKIVSHNHHMMELKCKVAETAQFDSDILIMGETGTGKELFARAIHQASQREGDFIPVNCGSIPKYLFESELFGHKKGAFTGAVSDKKGAFEQANHGTLFLDELGEMPLELQSKLLRAIEYRELKPVGSENLTNLDIKIVFATNKDLEKEVANGNFRKDLFFRISSPSFHIPQLQERTEDIPLLADHFRILFNQKFSKEVELISPDVINILKSHPWPGNVRELMKVIQIAIMNSNGSSITKRDLTDFFGKGEKGEEVQSKQDLPPATKINNEGILYWMKELQNNKTKVAETLKVDVRTIRRRCKSLNL